MAVAFLLSISSHIAPVAAPDSGPRNIARVRCLRLLLYRFCSPRLGHPLRWLIHHPQSAAMGFDLDVSVPNSRIGPARHRRTRRFIARTHQRQRRSLYGVGASCVAMHATAERDGCRRFAGADVAQLHRADDIAQSLISRNFPRRYIPSCASRYRVSSVRLAIPCNDLQIQSSCATQLYRLELLSCLASSPGGRMGCRRSLVRI